MILLFLSASCGGGGSSPAPAASIPAEYRGEYRGLSFMPSLVTLSVTETTITLAVSGGCRIQYAATRVDGGRVYYKVTESTCPSRAVGWEGWSDVSITGATLTERDQDGDTAIYARYPASPAPGQLLGNFRFIYTIQKVWEDRYVINKATGDYTSDGQEYFRGYNYDYPNVTIITAVWFSSASAYLAMENEFAGINATYLFTIGDGGQLTGCYYHYCSSTEEFSSCIALNSASRRYNRGAWAREARILTGEAELEQALQRLSTQYAEMERPVRLGLLEKGHGTGYVTGADQALQNLIDGLVQRTRVGSGDRRQ